MNADQPDFDALQRLLKLKRHEQPPPRYFNDFSGQVLNRIKADLPRERDDASARLGLSLPWWQRIVSAFRDEPIFAGACAAVFCTLLVGGAIYRDNQPPPSGSGGFETRALLPSSPVFATSALDSNRTNPAASLSGGSLFDVQPAIRSQSVTVRPAGD